ncbi:FAD-binding and (Fe-S)-binding domain-containing protein [Microbacterium alcoholitolerans]|uniref:FAD-binding and (Fe-S)-binding domain-containing protein n=1 Tax=unclassified Microbacterium TaxID=2609290 RepID=UPI003D18585C
MIPDLATELARVLGSDRVHTAALERHARAPDASHYLLIPQLAVDADDRDAVAQTLALATAHGAAVTFRSGGTSLSGQAAGTGVLLDTRRGFRGIQVLNDGERLRVEPGVTLRAANAHLARHGRALGPDPASEVACTVGGVIANNSSGMAAGTERNSYRTLESLVAVLPSGTIIDSADPDAPSRLAQEEPRLVAELARLRDLVRADPASVSEIRERFSMKNTMGYALNAFLDFEEPLDILVRLLVGSEGTLGFVAEATFRTVSVDPHVATGLLVFASVADAAAALPALVATDAATLELMDSTSLRVARRAPDAPVEISSFPLLDHAALLIEYRGADAAELQSRIDAAAPVLEGLDLIRAAALSTDPATRAALWKVRKGLYATVAGARPSGTTALLEDIVVPVDVLADTCDALSALLADFAYADSVIFGHAKDGNLHFMLTDDFSRPEAVARLKAFTEGLVDLVLARGGNLKAEHGTGRAMAPFVAQQYSAGLFAVMQGVKAAFDPAGILNPGVVLTEDATAYLRDLKPVVTVEEEVDRCVECGYCEPVCPSRDLTLTPRQRIVVRRARAVAEASGDRALARELEAAYEYDGIQTCAVDGMCQAACPVGINTGDLVKRLRREGRGRVEQTGWKAAAGHWNAVTGVARAALDVVGALPAPFVSLPNRAVRAVLGDDDIPLYTSDLPTGGRRRSHVAPPDAATPADAVLLPSCQGAMFAPGEAVGPGVQASFAALCAAVGIGLRLPADVDGLCCGTPWSSKGYAAGFAAMSERVLASLWAATDGGVLPVVVDAASCTEGVLRILHAADAAGDPRRFEVIDAVAFTAERVLPVLAPLDAESRVPSLALHPTCSSAALGIDRHLLALGEAVAQEVSVPVDWGCCGFAGDRGMLHPELTASATAAEAAEVKRLDAAAHASCNRACEIGMTRATGRTYSHVVELLAERHGAIDDGL